MLETSGDGSEWNTSVLDHFGKRCYSVKSAECSVLKRCLLGCHGEELAIGEEGRVKLVSVDVGTCGGTTNGWPTGGGSEQRNLPRSAMKRISRLRVSLKSHVHKSSGCYLSISTVEHSLVFRNLLKRVVRCLASLKIPFCRVAEVRAEDTYRKYSHLSFYVNERSPFSTSRVK